MSNHPTTSGLPTTRPKDFKIIQLNINGIRNRITELALLTTTEKPKTMTIQETKLNPSLKTPDLLDYTAISKDRITVRGGGLITYVHHSLNFTSTNLPNQNQIETIITKIETNPSLHVTNCYIPPRSTTTNIDDN